MLLLWVMQTFHRTHYRPDNAHLYIVGDVNVEQAEELIKKYFGHLESPPQPGLNQVRGQARHAAKRGLSSSSTEPSLIPSFLPSITRSLSRVVVMMWVWSVRR